MKRLTKTEMLNINAGGNISGALANAIWNGVKVFVDAGRCVGSAIRRLVSKNMC